MIAVATVAAVGSAPLAFSASLNVSATISASCAVTSANLAFGAYDPIVANATADLTANQALTIICTNGSQVSVLMDQGSYQAGGSTLAAPLRQMEVTGGGTAKLAYQLYTPTNNGTVWDGSTGVTYMGTGTSDNTTLVVYGVITHGQTTAVAGSYSDTVTISVNL